MSLAHQLTKNVEAAQTAAENQQTGNAIDEASRAHLRNLDVVMTRLLEETIVGRGQLADVLPESAVDGWL